MVTVRGKEAPYKGKEDNFQIAAAKFLNVTYPDLLWFHCPNGGSRNKFEAYKFKSMGVLPGVSDVIILKPNQKFSGLIIELKAAKGTLQKTQEIFLNKATNNGFKCVVCYNMESVIKTVKEYLKIK